MAFVNDVGKSVSFDCSDLIEELEADIAEFGEDLLVEVVTEYRFGVKIYKDYNFIQEEDSQFELTESEKIEVMFARELLALYEKENTLVDF